MKSKLTLYFLLGPVLIKGAKKNVYNLVYKSYLYTRSAKSKKGVVWKCSASKTDECKAKITTDEYLNIVVSKGEHTHKKPEMESKPKHVYFTTL